MDWNDNLVGFQLTLVSGPVFSIEHLAIRVSPWRQRIMPIIQNWYQLEAEKEMWNKTGLLSPITSGSQLSELFIESESDWHLAQSETSCVVDTLPFLGSLRGGSANQVPPTIIGLQLVTCRKVSLRLCLFKLALRYVIYVPVFFLVHPPKACPGSQCMCVHEERYWLQFLKHLKIVRHSFLIIFQTCEIFFLSISEVCTTCLPIRGQPASRWVLLHPIII